MHAISIYITRKIDLREDRINTILDEGDKLNTKELGEDIYAILDDIDPKEFSKGRMVASINTDYFGGPGDQSAKLWKDGKLIYENSTRVNEWDTPINDALDKMGVTPKNGCDNFDTVGLGRYRKNEDFYDR